MKFSVLMPYHDRFRQLATTISTFRRLYARNDYEVIIVVDAKSNSEVEALGRLKARNVEVNLTIVEAEHTDTLNPAPHYNQAARLAKGEYLILTSPEVCHRTPVLDQLDKILAEKPEAYIVAACEAVTERGDHYMWYQHSRNRNNQYHFCTCIRASTYRNIGGFDEVYAAGVSYDDDDFLATVKAAGIEILALDTLQTIHQNHAKPLERTSERRRLVQVNRDIYTRKWGKELPL